jgi:hypothetical protein
MNDKKRYVIIPDVGRIRLKSRKLKSIKHLDVAKVKFKDCWYIFDINTEIVLSQGTIWNEVLNDLIPKRYDKKANKKYYI